MWGGCDDSAGRYPRGLGPCLAHRLWWSPVALPLGLALQVCAMSGLCQRKKSVAGLRQDIAQTLRLLQLQHDAILDLDEKHTILFVNQGAENAFVYQASEIVGKSVDILLACVRQPFFLTPLPGPTGMLWARDDDKPLRCILGRRKAGDELHLDVSVSRFSYGGEQTLPHLLPEHGVDPDTLLLRAEGAMYVAKREGRPRIYEPGSPRALPQPREWAAHP